jgi:hypothetical protein
METDAEPEEFPLAKRGKKKLLMLTFPLALIAPLEVRAEHETAPNDPVPLLEMVLKFVVPEHEMLPNDPVPLLEMVLKFVFPEHEMLLNDPVPLQATFPNDPVPVQAMDAAEMVPLTATCEAPTGPNVPVPPPDVILVQVTPPLPLALKG